MDEAERCDRIGWLVAGRLVRQGPPLDLIRRIEAPLFEVKGAGARATRRAVRAFPGVELVFPVGETLRVWLGGNDDAEAFRAAIEGLPTTFAVRPLRPSLHDVALRDLALAADRGNG